MSKSQILRPRLSTASAPDDIGRNRRHELMQATLVTSKLTKSYGGSGPPALGDVSIELTAGEVHALVGENGAGKSTFCRIVSGIISADSGSMRLRGEAYA